MKRKRKAKVKVVAGPYVPRRIPLEKIDRKAPKGKCWKVTLTLNWCPENSPFPRKQVYHPNDGSTTWEYTVTRMTTRPVYARSKPAAERKVKKAWRKLFGKAVLKFTRINVKPYVDLWELTFAERNAKKLARISRIKKNRAKRVRSKS